MYGKKPPQYCKVISFQLKKKKKNLLVNAGDMGSILGSGRSPGVMAAHSSILAWEIPRTEDPVGLQFKGSQKSWTRLSD